ncbi:IPT/TIG domain-containing protein, partial [bacterium]|nr:IPT/TIG domain-containing protein [bacterium]
GFSGSITIHFGTSPSIATGINVGSDGSFNGTFTVNSQPAGTIVVTAENNTGVFATISFCIKGVITSVNPNQGIVGTEVTVKGAGFNDGEVVYIDFGSYTTITTAIANTDGNFTATFTVDTQSQDAAVITARDSREIATAVFMIKAGITLLSPSYGGAGQMVTIEGIGYGNMEVVRIDFGTHQTITSTVSSQIGTFSAVFTVSAQPSGNIVVTAKGNTSGVYDTTAFALTVISITPASGTGSAGVMITITGTGFSGTKILQNSITVGGFICTHAELGIIGGGFSGAITLPALPAGSHSIQIITDTPSTNNFVDRYTVRPAITLLPWGGTGVNNNISTITGTGFTGAANITDIRFGTKPPNASLPAIPIVISQQGTFTAVLTLPSLAGTGIIVYATDSVTRFATAIYNVNTSVPKLQSPVLTPTSGSVGNTVFNFQINYRDTGSDPPYSGYPRVLLYLNGLLKQELPLAWFSGAISTGAVYKGTTTISTSGSYTYKIIAYDQWGVPAVGYPIDPITGSGPVVTGGVVPELIWSGETGYESDGVDPNSGTTGDTFTFRVGYRDTSAKPPASGYPKVYIRIDGATIAIGTLTLVSGSAAAGTYSYQTVLSTASTDYNYYFEAYNTSTVQAIGTPTNIPAGTFTVTGPNLAPTLSWTGNPGYGTEGVSPDKGATGITFSFEVLYKDANNDSGSVTLELTNCYGTISTYTMTPQGTTSAAGVRFAGSVTLNTLGTYSHRFLATDIKGSSSTTPLVPDLPEVLTPPELLWTGETNYTNDGLHPESDIIGTIFYYHVLYKHTNAKQPASDYGVKLHIMQGSSPFATITMTFAGGTWSTGATYTTNYSFGQAGNYSYCFSAKDIDGAFAFGSPTQISSGNNPLVSSTGGGNCPVLSYVTVPQEFGADGLSPKRGVVSFTPITFMVKYTDINNDPPASGFPKVVLEKGVVPYGMFSMNQCDTEDTRYNDGKDYILTMPIDSTSVDYNFKFSAQDVTGTVAIGVPTGFRAAPDITQAPDLSWSSNTGFIDDGVNPNSGSVGNYRFEVKYTSSDNYAPLSSYPKVHIAIGGKEIGGSPFAMTVMAGGAYPTGMMYYKILTLSVASNDYSYWFETQNIYQVIGTGGATQPKAGPGPITGTNVVPTLGYQGTGSFTSDGVDPDKGTPGAVYTFRVKYTDQNNNPPQAVSLIIKKSTAIVYNAAMTKIVEGTLSEAANGIVYEATCTLTEIGTDYTYTFYATDTSNGVATALYKTGPVVNSAPTLEWVGGTNYASDGVHPDSGSATLTSFTFKIKYKDAENNAPATGYPKVRIAIGGKDIGTYSMTQSDSNPYTTGRGYAYTLILGTASKSYNYWFEAKDVNQIPTSTTAISGPDVSGSNTAPQLTLGTVTPSVGTIGTEFIFRVKYTDANNDLPASGDPKVFVTQGGAVIGTYSLATQTAASPAEGMVYYSVPVTFTTTGSNYYYYFKTEDAPSYGNTATTQTSSIPGPSVTNAPVISGFVTPSSGPAGPRDFILSYTDPESELPATGYPRVFIKKSNGSYLYGSPFLLVGSPPTYSASIQLTEAGTYTFWFEAKDAPGLKVVTSEQVATVTGSPAPTLPTIVKPQQIEVTACYNYPNPTYNGNTKIRVEFSGGTKTALEISIYDVAGDLVIENLQEKGHCDQDGTSVEYAWDGRNGNGRQVANGVYFARCVIDLGDKKYAKIIKIAIIR